MNQQAKEGLGLPIGTTLDRFIKSKQDEFKYASGELSQLLRDIALAGKIINREVNKSGLLDITGNFGDKNVHGESQQKLDIIANIRFTRALRNGSQVCAILSEEEDEIIPLNKNSKYVVAIDPLDGSSNIDVNVSIGTIFSIYRRLSPIGSTVTNEDVLQKGINQVAAGYILYGSSTILVYTTGHGVYGFTLEPSLGEFVLSHSKMNYPKTGTIYSTNEGYLYKYQSEIQQFIDQCKREEVTARYVGSLVADFHRNLLKGGIYLYPSMTGAPEGKLRLMYECNALALIAEQSGGIATDGKQRILEIEPKSFHQRSPFFIGSENLIEGLLRELE